MVTEEKRRAPRYPLIASAEVIELQTDAHLSARTSDLSLGGCYLDMPNSLPVGTEISLRIVHSGVTFTALAVVAYCQPNMGMGIKFTNVQSDQYEILREWLAGLASPV